MSVEAIRLKNFMAFQDTDWIELRPITLLFGKNSSGKSVIGRALRLLKQSLGAEAGSGPFVYAARQGVDVGDFITMTHSSEGSPNDKDQKPITFAFRCRLVDTLDPLLHLVNQQRRREDLAPIPASQAQDQVELGLQYEWNKELGQAWLTELEITYPQPDAEQQPRLIVFVACRLDSRAVTEGQDEWWPHSDILHGHEVDRDSAWAGSRIELVSGFLPTLTTPELALASGATSGDDVRFVVALLRELRQTVEQFLRRTDYLDPLRPEPEREFVFDAQRIRDWQGSGLRGYLRYLSYEVDQSVMGEIDRWLQEVGLSQSALSTNFYSFPGRALVARVDIYEKEQKEPRNLLDVGFGVSQALPVIIQCLVADGDSTVLIEQPELHLHPSAQVALGDLFVAASKRKKRLLIETHSEHLLYRLRWHIANKTLQTLKGEQGEPPTDGSDLDIEDLAAYFVSREETESRTHPIEINELGDIVDEPEEFREFFADDAVAIMNLTHVALQAEMLKRNDNHERNRSH